MERGKERERKIGREKREKDKVCKKKAGKGRFGQTDLDRQCMLTREREREMKSKEVKYSISEDPMYMNFLLSCVMKIP
jgi:hypothetical protein